MSFPLSQQQILLFLPFASQAHRSLLPGLLSHTGRSQGRWSFQMKEGHCMRLVKSHVHLQDTEGLPLSSLPAVPGLANRTQLCLMHLNNTTTRSSLGTAQPSQPAGRNSSDSDSESNKTMLLLEGAAAAETSHFLCWDNYGFTRCHFMLQNGFQRWQTAWAHGELCNPFLPWKEQSHQSAHTKK